MYISHVAIKNFRALTDIDCDFSPRMNVIVGPNAVGKTTILQALRLAKGLIAPRTKSEAQQVLISLGAASPHFPQRLFPKNIVQNQHIPMEVRCTYVVTDAEIAVLKESTAEFIQNLVASRMGQGFENPAQLLQFLQSPMAIQEQQRAGAEIAGAIKKIEQDKKISIALRIDASTGQIISLDPLGGPLIAFLDQSLPPTTSFFSYFPADRALPMGDVNMQLGGPDIQQQLESHNSQPQLKYQRLKTVIVNSLVTDDDKPAIREDFEKIFSGLLRGRRIKKINFNELGLVSIQTEEISTGRLIELDALSSGEKNIALTFLLVARSVAKGGIALFDEPELHLNPAVCRELLPFMMKEYSKGRDIQFIMCTHSPEILAGAFKDDDCALLHLKSPNDITRIGKSAKGEYSDALKRLGTSVEETLLYDGTILVEGDEDIAFLTVGYPDLLKKYQVKGRGGRREIEKDIKNLLELETNGRTIAPIYLIFDKDDEPTNLKGSQNVRVLQWQRRCAENYLIDIDVIADLLKDGAVTKTPFSSAGEIRTLCRDLAFKQLDDLALRYVYNSYGYKNASITTDDLKGGSIEDKAAAIFARMDAARVSLPNAMAADWIPKFLSEVGARKIGLQLEWDANWVEVCDGKRLISDLHKASGAKMSEPTFKERLVRIMRDTQSDSWKLVKAQLESLLKKSE